MARNNTYIHIHTQSTMHAKIKLDNSKNTVNFSDNREIKRHDHQQQSSNLFTNLKLRLSITAQ